MIKNQGFTLVELLVTMSLLSMIILIGSSAFSMFSQRWDGQLGNFDKSARDARNVMLVQNILDSLVPYVTDDTDGGPIIYFEGNRNGFVSVSSQSIQSPEDYAVIRFSVKQDIDLLAMAPTGSGKTAVALIAILQAFKRGLRAVYTSPIKALSNQKYAEFCEWFLSASVFMITSIRERLRERAAAVS